MKCYRMSEYDKCHRVALIINTQNETAGMGYALRIMTGRSEGRWRGYAGLYNKKYNTVTRETFRHADVAITCAISDLNDNVTPQKV